MHPILFHIGPFSLHAFGVMMALGFLAALLAMRRLARGTSLTDDALSRLLVWLMAGGVLGARLAFVAEHWRAEFMHNPLSILRVDQGGLMFYGGVAGAIAAVWLFARVNRLPFFTVLDITAAVLPLGHAFGRMGCFLNGCCHGREWHGLGAVCFPPESLPWEEQVRAGLILPSAPASLPLLPTQLLEMVANLALFGALCVVYRRMPRRGTVTAAYLLGYPVIRFLIEFLRGDPRMVVGALSIGQVISIVLFATGLALYGAVRKRRSDEQPS